MKNIALGAIEAKSGDVLLVARPAENPEEVILEGSFGCYVSKDGTGIQTRLDSLEAKNVLLEAKNDILEEKINSFELINQRKCAIESGNDLVHLIYVLESVMIKTIFPEAVKKVWKEKLKNLYELKALVVAKSSSDDLSPTMPT